MSGSSTSVKLDVLRGEVLEPQSSLVDLIEQANQSHHKVEEALGQALNHVIRSGIALTEVRNRFVHRGWEKWANENFDGGATVASYYIRIAAYRELVSDLPNVTQAITRLRGMPALRPPGYKGYGEEIRNEARALAENGMAKAEIARILGVADGTVANWIDPETLKRHRARVQEQSRKRREETRKKKREADRRAAEREARRVGGALAEAYSLAHKIEAPLARAARNASSPEAKAELEKAVGFQHQMLYNIIRALGAS